MAAHITAIIHDGIIDIPEEVKAEPGYHNGSTVRITPISAQQERKVDVSAWRKLEGFFASEPGDLNEMFDEERKWELEKEAQ